MYTDPIPRQADRRDAYQKSDVLLELDVPPADLLRPLAAKIEQTLQDGARPDVERTCRAFAVAAAQRLGVPVPTLAVLGVRPHRTDGGVCVYEKFGDYDLRTAHIRLWMRTAMRHKVTSYGTLLSTLCHELCHHLDLKRYEFLDTPHTRGFYQRAALLYHQARGTPLRPLHWVKQKNGTYRINWGVTMQAPT